MRPLYMPVVVALGASLLVPPAGFSQSPAVTRPAPQAPPRDTTPAPTTGIGQIRGQVVHAETGAPLRRAQVRLFGGGETHVTSTDDRGRYEFKDLPAGRYTLAASRAGFVTLNYGQRRFLEPGRPLELIDKQRLERIDFRLPRGGVVAGTITDELGEPVAGALVQVAQYRMSRGQRRLVPMGAPDTTDDLGQFRVYGVPPGTYYVSAAPRSVTFGTSDDRADYATTYYPGTLSAASAQALSIDLGQDTTGVTFPLVAARTARISGTAIGSDGRPLTPAMVMLRSLGAVGAMGMGGRAQIQRDGTFIITNVTPGDYAVEARRTSDGADADIAVMDLTVAGDDITGLRLVATRGVTARGQIVFDTGQRPTPADPASVRIVANPARLDGIGYAPGRSVVKADWSFEMEGLRGEQFIRAGQLPPGWLLKAVMYQGTDVTDTAMNFQGGGEVTGLQVVLTQKHADISGGVEDDRGVPAKDYVVLVFADDRAKWGFLSRRVRTGRPEQGGTFLIRELPPGEYLAIALEYLEPGEETNPEFLEKLRDHATGVTIEEGETRRLDLKLISVF